MSICKLSAIAIVAILIPLSGAAPKAIRGFPIVPQVVSEVEWNAISPRLVKVISGRDLLTDQGIKAIRSADRADMALRRYMKQDSGLMDGIVKACLKGGFKYPDDGRLRSVQIQQKLRSQILEGSRIDPWSLWPNPSDWDSTALANKIEARNFSGLTHALGRVAIWHVRSRGSYEQGVTLDGAAGEDELDVKNTIISFAHFPAAVNRNLHGGNEPEGVPVLLNFKYTTSVAVLHGGGHLGGYKLRYSMRPKPIQDALSGKNGVASDVFYDPTIGERGRFLYRNYEGTPKSLEGAYFSWKEGRKSAFAPIECSSTVRYVTFKEAIYPRGTASIAGKLSYPSEGIPSLCIVARNVDTGHFYHVTSKANWGDGSDRKQPDELYVISGLPVGRYTVMCYDRPAHPDDWANLNRGAYAGYTAFTAAGDKGSDHTLKVVKVMEGQKVKGIDPSDGYAMVGDIPPLPF